MSDCAAHIVDAEIDFDMAPIKFHPGPTSLAWGWPCVPSPLIKPHLVCCMLYLPTRRSEEYREWSSAHTKIYDRCRATLCFCVRTTPSVSGRVLSQNPPKGLATSILHTRLDVRRRVAKKQYAEMYSRHDPVAARLQFGFVCVGGKGGAISIQRPHLQSACCNIGFVSKAYLRI